MSYTAMEYERGEPLIVIWEQPYVHGGPAKDCLGWFTPAEAAEEIGLSQEYILSELSRCGRLDTSTRSVEWT